MPRILGAFFILPILNILLTIDEVTVCSLNDHWLFFAVVRVYRRGSCLSKLLSPWFVSHEPFSLHGSCLSKLCVKNSVQLCDTILSPWFVSIAVVRVSRTTNTIAVVRVSRTTNTIAVVRVSRTTNKPFQNKFVFWQYK
jgi:hypothetical protein